MNKIISSLDLSKYDYAFFDVDGVLSIPYYMVDDDFRVGGTEDWWFEYNMKNHNTYKDCRVSKSLYNFIELLCGNGINCKVLTAEPFDKTLENKSNFILDKYGDLFCQGDIYSVAKTDDKVDFLKSFCDLFGCPRGRVLVVDDNFDLCIKLQCKGFKALHNSYFME